VSGKGLRDWAVRQGALVVTAKGASTVQRFLDLRPLLAAAATDPRELELVVRTRLRKPALPGATAVMILTPGEAVGFASKITVTPDASVDFRVTSATGMVPVGE